LTFRRRRTIRPNALLLRGRKARVPLHQDFAMRSSRKALRRADDLVAAGLVPPEYRAGIEALAARYALALTDEVAGLIDPADPHDPIARQFVPDPAELEVARGEMADPIGDDAHSPVEGIVHR